MQPPSTEPAVETPKGVGFLPTVGGKYFALGVLFAMNLLNYIDRYSFYAIAKPIEDELKISDQSFGYLAAAFIIVYTIVSPLMGILGDRFNRRVLIAGGVALWSLATVGTAFSTDYYHMYFWRSLLGIGEASYGVIAPALMADLFPVRERGRAMGIYYLALPLGGAIGYAIGSVVAQYIGWREVFYVVGIPGLLAAVLALVIVDPGRGASEGKVEHTGDKPKLADYLALFTIPTFVFNTAGMAAVTFATGAYAVWGAKFYQSVRGLTLAEAGMWIGGLTAVAGLIGIVLGTVLADKFNKVTKRAYLLLAALALAIAIPLGMFGILDTHRASSLTFLFGAMVLLAMVLGPCNTVIANVVPSNRRAAGFALYIFLIHVFGDITSPILLGWISDHFGTPAVAGSPMGKFFAGIGAVPVDGKNLTLAMLSVVPVMALGCLFFLIGSRSLPSDQEKARLSGGDDSQGGFLGH